MSDKSTNVFDLIASIVTSKEIIIAALGGVIGTFLSPWTKWLFAKKKIQIDNRKEKIRLWREELNKVDSLSDFYKTPLYNELAAYIPEKELKELFHNNNIEVTTLGDTTSVTTQDNRIIARFHKAVSEIEKKWGII
jgi:hypothetical protein